MVVDGNFQRVAATSPVNRIVTSACFGNRTDIANLYSIGIGLCKHCLADFFCRADVGFLCAVRFPVCGGGNHAADMQYIVGTCNRFQNAVIVCQVAPNDFYGRIVHVGGKFLFLFLALAQ